MRGMFQQVGLNRAFVLQTRNGPRCAHFINARTAFGGQGVQMRFICDSQCGLTAKRPTKSCRMGGGQSFLGGGSALQLPSGFQLPALR